MKLSARNRLKGKITAVQEGAVNGVVVIDLGGQLVKSDITMEAIRELGLKAGQEACAIIKASNVMIASGSKPISNISARNQFVGSISKINKGAVNGHVSLKLNDGNTITASITNEAIDSLGLKEGGTAVAVIKATDVIVGIE
jgi:molybdate transport system regulatory protein